MPVVGEGAVAAKAPGIEKNMAKKGQQKKQVGNRSLMVENN